MRRECWERFPYRLQRKPLVSDPGIYHGTCVTHVLWCMSWSLTRGGGVNVPGIPGAYATRKFTYLEIGPWSFLLTRGCCGFADCFNAFYLKLEYIMAYIQSVLLSKWSLWRSFTSKLHNILGTVTLTMGIFRSPQPWRQWIRLFENTSNIFNTNCGVKDIHHFSVVYIEFM